MAFPVLMNARLPQQDSLLLKSDTVHLANDTVAAIIPTKDSIVFKKDSIPVASMQSYHAIMERALSECYSLNTKSIPVNTIYQLSVPGFDGNLFYLIFGVVLLLAMLRYFYSRYFSNLFRVFFNTSLRQSQITDQLLQARQVSLFFNLLFVITAGLYAYVLFDYFKLIHTSTPLLTIGVCVLSVTIIYFLKYVTLKFTGWLTGYQSAVNAYLFVIFLINKILTVLLLPFVLVIAFANNYLQYPAIIISLLMIGLMFLLRFLRSYGLLQKQIKVSRAHFFLYIIGVELIPLLLIYKAMVILLNKNL
jgi:hypothetical protein